MRDRLSGLVLAAVTLGCLALAGCARTQAVLSDEEAYQRFVGTWVNAEHSGIGVGSQRIVIKADHSGEDWALLDSPGPSSVWALHVKKTWVDQGGTTYCQYTTKRSPWANSPPDFWNSWLMRVDKARKNVTFRYGSTGAAEDALVFPEHIDPHNLRNTWTYQRKK